MNVSVLYRYSQKYFDTELSRFGIGSGQMSFLLDINENEGITMRELTALGDVDKGTTTKSIQKLSELGYIEVRSDETDKRVKRLYTTKKTGEIINDLYRIRNGCVNALFRDIDEEDLEKGADLFQKVADNARELDQEEESYSRVKLGGVQKLTLLDYPNQVACTLFTAGCNMKCPFCHNRDLVYIPENFEFTDPEDVIGFLQKRRGVLDAVAITGGEPLLQKGILEFIARIKELGYLVKLDTNGYYPEKLKEAVETGMIDYVAMDIKNVPEKYPQTTGLPELRYERIRESIDYLLSGPVDYEFRTTVVREFHTLEDLKALAEGIKGARHYYLQQFVDSGRCISECHPYSNEEMKEIGEEIKKILPVTECRGV